MDIRYGMVVMPLAELLTEYQRDGCTEDPDEALPRLPIFDRVVPQAPEPQVTWRASGWRALPLVAAVARLWSGSQNP